MENPVEQKYHKDDVCKIINYGHPIWWHIDEWNRNHPNSQVKKVGENDVVIHDLRPEYVNQLVKITESHKDRFGGEDINHSYTVEFIGELSHKFGTVSWIPESNLQLIRSKIDYDLMTKKLNGKDYCHGINEIEKIMLERMSKNAEELVYPKFEKKENRIDLNGFYDKIKKDR